MKHLYLVISLFICLSSLNGVARGVSQKSKIYIPVAEGFTYLSISSEEEEVVIGWGLVEIENPDYFIVERQIDAQPFETIGGLNYHTSRPTRVFSFSDIAPVRNARVTYRVKVVREDGSFFYSDKISVFMPENKDFFTHPSILSDVLNLEYALPALTPYEIRLFDFYGNVKFYRLDKHPAELHIQDRISVGNLPAGLYILQVIHGNQIHTRRVIKD
ncbi:MAG: T9SS type A sorting domain-containing protein [Bacteroidia bacterium]|nr:T9SS type A sorting domain-containing protein [Bacteroidia bacterium]